MSLKKYKKVYHCFIWESGTVRPYYSTTHFGPGHCWPTLHTLALTLCLPVKGNHWGQTTQEHHDMPELWNWDSGQNCAQATSFPTSQISIVWVILNELAIKSNGHPASITTCLSSEIERQKCATQTSQISIFWAILKNKNELTIESTGHPTICKYSSCKTILWILRASDSSRIRSVYSDPPPGRDRLATLPQSQCSDGTSSWFTPGQLPCCNTSVVLMRQACIKLGRVICKLIITCPRLGIVSLQV